MKHGQTKNSYTAEIREQAVADIAELGLARAAMKHPTIPKTTLRYWAQGRDVALVNPEAQAKAVAATEVSRVNRAERIADSEERTAILLAVIQETAARVEIEMLKAGNSSLSEVVGSRTRAFHDMRILKGAATEHIEVVTRDEIVNIQARLRERLGLEA